MSLIIPLDKMGADIDMQGNPVLVGTVKHDMGTFTYHIPMVLVDFISNEEEVAQ